MAGNVPKDFVQNIMLPTEGMKGRKEVTIKACLMYSIYMLRNNKVFRGGLDIMEAVIKFDKPEGRNILRGRGCGHLRILVKWLSTWMCQFVGE